MEVRKHFLVGFSKYRGSIYALSMSIHYPKYTQIIPNVSTGLILGETNAREKNLG